MNQVQVSIPCPPQVELLLMHQTGGNKILHLEGLRGIAALFVLFHHYVLAFYPALYSGLPKHSHMNTAFEIFISGSPLNILYNGRFGIGVFFVLSGYVLSHRFFSTGSYESLAAGATKRYLRLMLPILFSLSIAYALMKTSAFHNAELATITNSSWLKQWWDFKPRFTEYISQALWGAVFNNQSSYNSVVWTMSYEFYGSLMVFAFLALFGRLRMRAVVYVVAAVLTFKTNYFAFLLGMLLCDLSVNAADRLRPLRTPLLWTVLLAAGVYLGSFATGRMAYGNIGQTIYGIIPYGADSVPAIFYNIVGAFLIMAAMELSGAMQRLFSLRPFVYLGRISFSMYLLHFIVLGSLSSFLFIRLNAAHLPYGVSFLLTFGVSLAVIWVSSHYMYRFIDRKAIDLSRALYERVFRRVG